MSPRAWHYTFAFAACYETLAWVAAVSDGNAIRASVFAVFVVMFVALSEHERREAA